MFILLTVSMLLPVTIDSKYVDWKGGCWITGGTIPLIRKSPLLIDPSMMPNSTCSMVAVVLMVTDASNRTVPIGVHGLALELYCVELKTTKDWGASTIEWISNNTQSHGNYKLVACDKFKTLSIFSHKQVRKIRNF